MIDEYIGSSVTLIMHHPHFFTGEYWNGWSEETGCNVLGYDAPFHGGAPAGSFEEFAERCVLDARAQTSSTLVAVGVSQGGVIAQECGRYDGVAAVVGISTTRCEASDDERAAMSELLDRWGENGPGDNVARMIATTSTNGDEPAYSRTVRAVSAMSAEQVRGSIPMLLSRRGNIPLGKPTLFIHGTSDRTYRLDQCLIGEGLNILPIDGGSHSLAIQSRSVVAREIRRFVDSLLA